MNAPWIVWLKQVFLAVSTVYFYVTALGLTYGWRIGVLASPEAFAAMGTVLVAALLLEMLLVWWHVRKRIFWGSLGILTYASIGFVAAPGLFGRTAIWVALLLPLVVVFLGGFVYVFVHLLARALLPRHALRPADLHAALRRLPGWKAASGRLAKTYRFPSVDDALRFADVCELIAAAKFSHLHLSVEERSVTVSLWTPGVGGIISRDVEVARELDRR